MKKILVASLLVISGSAFAHGSYGYYNHYHGGGNNWVAPLIIGGMVGYAINRPPVVYTQPPVVYPAPITTIPTVQTQTCTAWTEIQNPDGTVSRTRTCSQ